MKSLADALAEHGHDGADTSDGYDDHADALDGLGDDTRQAAHEAMDKFIGHVHDKDTEGALECLKRLVDLLDEDDGDGADGEDGADDGASGHHAALLLMPHGGK